MTLSTVMNRVRYDGNGVTTLFTVPFPFFSSDDLSVVLRTAAGSESTVDPGSYSVTGGDGSTGSITMGTAPATGQTLIIYRDIELEQDLSLQTNGPLPAEEVEARLDKLTMMAQRFDERINRALILNDADESVAMVIPLQGDRSLSFLGFDALGRPIAAHGLDTSNTVVSTFAKTVLDDLNAGAMLTTLGVTPFAQKLLVDTTSATVLAELGVSSYMRTLLDDTTYATALQTLGLTAWGINRVSVDLSASNALAALGMNVSQAVATGNGGHGGTNTKIRRFNTITTTGTAITSAQSAANGDSFTINEAGLYHVSYLDNASGAASQVGVTVNSAQLTTNYFSTTSSARIVGVIAAAAAPACGAQTVRLAVGDIVRAHTDGTPDSSDNLFKIMKISGL